MDKDFEEFFDTLDEIMDEFFTEDTIKSSPHKKTFSSIFNSFEPKPVKKNNIFNNYFQEELDDNCKDDYVINGFGSLDNDE